MHRIEITFGSDPTSGKVDAKIEVQGAVGQECLDLTQPLEAALGLSDIERVETPEHLIPNIGQRETAAW